MNGHKIDHNKFIEGGYYLARPSSKQIAPKEKTEVKNIVCSSCGESKPEVEFFTSNNTTLHKSGKYPYCKDCLRNQCLDTSGIFNIPLFQQVLKAIDRPFLYDILAISEAENPSNIIGVYLRNMALKKHRMKKWSDSVFEAPKKNISRTAKPKKKSDQFVLTNEIKEFFGGGYSDDEYEAMQRKYNFLRKNYQETTNMHIEALISYVRYKVKEEFAIADNNTSDAKVWSDLANKAATAAKINPSQLSKADLMGGLNTFSELSQAIEEAVDVIPILPQFKARPSDALDFNIWCYINYARDLQGLPLCKYEDVYAFYDRRKEDYVKQYGDPYGFFSQDNSENNRENIKRFIAKTDDFDDDISDEEEILDGTL